MAQVTTRWLRKAGQPHVFGWTQILADRGDMVDCDATGKALIPSQEEVILARGRKDENLDKSTKEVLPSDPVGPVVFASEDGEPTPSIEEVVAKRKRGRPKAEPVE